MLLKGNKIDYFEVSWGDLFLKTTSMNKGIQKYIYFEANKFIRVILTMQRELCILMTEH